MLNEYNTRLALGSMWHNTLRRLDETGGYLWADVASDYVVQLLAEFGFAADDDDRIQTAMQIGFLNGIEYAAKQDDLPLDGQDDGIRAWAQGGIVLSDEVQVPEDDPGVPVWACRDEAHNDHVVLFLDKQLPLGQMQTCPSCTALTGEDVVLAIHIPEQLAIAYGLITVEPPKPEVEFKVEKVFKAGTNYVPMWTVVQFVDGVARGGDHHWVAEEFATRAYLLYSVAPHLHGMRESVLASEYKERFNQDMFVPTFGGQPGPFGRWEGRDES